VPKGKFTVRCPRCQNLLRADAGSGRNSAVEQMKRNAPAPAVDKEAQAGFAQKESEFEINTALRSLLGALQKETTTAVLDDDEEVKPRRILLCLDPAKRDLASKILIQAGYKVYAAETPAQANERLREGRIEILLYSTDFAADLGGAAMVQQKVNSMASSERRRLFVACIDDHVTTMNAHEAFLKNLNLTVNVTDLDQIPMVLNRALRDFNEIYRHYNKAVGQAGV
jgi:CheY-like chemotaxis protein